MSEPIKLYRNGEMIETCAPSVAREWQAQGWSLTPDMMPNSAPDELPLDGLDITFPVEFDPNPNIVFVEPAQPKRKAGRPRKE